MKSVFKPASKSTIELIASLNKHQRNTFLIPTKFISSECAQAGYLLNEFYNYERPSSKQKNYKTFFSNSGLEALHGAIKIVRHNHRKNKRTILIYTDQPGQLERLFDPLGKGPKNALIPYVEFMNDLESLNARIAKQDEEIAGVVINTQSNLGVTEIDKLFELLKRKKIMTLIDERDNPNFSQSIIHQLRELPDVVIMGEGLAQNEVAIGAFSMTEKVYKPWARLTTCLLHSSTYSGNRLSLSMVRNNLQSLFSSNNSILMNSDRIAESFKNTKAAFAKYVNPKLVDLYGLAGLDINPIQSHGNKLQIESIDDQLREVIDGVSGGGLAIRGHTPDDLVNDVLMKHDSKHDYWSELAQKLCKLTGFDHAFPSISGAGAVEIAISLAMIANHTKTKIITFKGNYAGKTLLALNCTDTDIMDNRGPFGPLYSGMVYIDPFAKDAPKILREELLSGDVALVWLEVIQGMSGKEIPTEVLKVIDECKEAGGYYVGVDEILMGFFRAGQFLSHEGKMCKPDIITISKALTDATIPISTTLVSSKIYQQASHYNAELTAYYESAYVNQLASHISGHLIEKLPELGLDTKVNDISSYISNQFEQICRDNKFISQFAGHGLYFYFVYNLKPMPLKILGQLSRNLYSLFFAGIILNQANTFVMIDRFLPALTISRQEIDQFVASLKSVLSQKPMSMYLKFYWYILKLIFKNLFTF